MLIGHRTPSPSFILFDSIKVPSHCQSRPPVDRVSDVPRVLPTWVRRHEFFKE